jgi:hypothetical protein
MTVWNSYQLFLYAALHKKCSELSISEGPITITSPIPDGSTYAAIKEILRRQLFNLFQPEETKENENEPIDLKVYLTASKDGIPIITGAWTFRGHPSGQR